MSNTSTHSSTRRLTEGGICIALALVLSYLKIPIGLSFGGFGGSITLVMVPLILFAVRYGAPWGILAGVAFGTLKYFFAEGFAVSWVSIIFDYSLRAFSARRATTIPSSRSQPSPAASAALSSTLSPV